MEFISAASSKLPNCCDWGPDGVICFASGDLLLYSDPPAKGSLGGRKISGVATHHHKASIRSVRWITGFLNEESKRQSQELVLTTSDDKTAAIWIRDATGNFLPEVSLQGHTSAVAVGDAIAGISDRLLVVTGSTDCSVRIWQADVPNQSSEVLQVIDLGTKYPISLRMAGISDEFLCLAIATDCGNVTLHVADLNLPNPRLFTKACSLGMKGYWTSAMDFVLLEKECLLLATGSQDGLVQLWRVEPYDNTDSTDEDLCQQLRSLGSETTAAESSPKTAEAVCEVVIQESTRETVTEEPLPKEKKAEGEIKFTTEYIRELVRRGDEILHRKMLSIYGEEQKDEHKPQNNKLQKDVSRTFLLGTKIYNARSESVLRGHEGATYGIHWGKIAGELHLLSASFDKTLILWSQNPTTGLWAEKHRLGEIGGNWMGFYGARISPSGEELLAHGFLGALQFWTHDKELDSWVPQPSLGGHTGGISDICWEPLKGNYLLSAGLDQTTRLFAEWKRNGGSSWHEFFRPQVHGHDLFCLSPVPNGSFLSGGEEKVVRVFGATRSLAQGFKELTAGKELLLGVKDPLTAPMASTLPSLGLSNRGLFEGDIPDVPEEKSNLMDYQEPDLRPITWNAPPAEEFLITRTLWAEHHKLYGHPYEIIAVAASHDGRFAASSCKAQQPEHAVIILWDAATWELVDRLPGHQLTVTRLAFSPNDQFLLSVSRDRSWQLHKRTQDGSSYTRVFGSTKSTKGSHARIIWDCAWLDDRRFLTASRDKKVVLWSLLSPEACPEATLTLTFPAAVTSVAAVGGQMENVFAVGLENGEIRLLEEDHQIQEISGRFAHNGTVKRLAFRPGEPSLLASCGSDGLLYLHRLQLHIPQSQEVG